MQSLPDRLLIPDDDDDDDDEEDGCDDGDDDTHHDVVVDDGTVANAAGVPAAAAAAVEDLCPSPLPRQVSCVAPFNSPLCLSLRAGAEHPSLVSLTVPCT